MSHSYVIRILDFMKRSSIVLGGPAPDFTLYDQDGNIAHLKEILSKQPAVLVFYPGDLTPGCTVQLCAIRGDWNKFQAAKIAVFGINHGNADAHKAFMEKHGFPFPLLVDVSKKVSKTYGATKPLFKATVIARSVVGIGQDGLVKYLKRGMPLNAEVLKAMSLPKQSK